MILYDLCVWHKCLAGALAEQLLAILGRMYTNRHLIDNTEELIKGTSGSTADKSAAGPSHLRPVVAVESLECGMSA